MASISENRLFQILAAIYEKTGSDKAEAEKLSKNAVGYMNKTEKELKKDIRVRLVKGGTYKIKGYYLENNELPDIRGASAIITAVQEEIIPQTLNSAVGFDCILYNGGGNLFAIVPEKTDVGLGEALESEAQKYLVTANSAYYVSDIILLSELLGNDYKRKIAEKENQLDKRKKLKINFEPSPESAFLGKELFGVAVNGEKNSEHKFCEKCRKRVALYKTKDKYVCGGCLHKGCVGNAQKIRYFDEYKEYLKKIGVSSDKIKIANSQDEINGDHIAVVYADGNNMGGIIQSFKKLTDMMDFSSFVKKNMPEIVFSSMHKCGIDRFEIVAMGGDDIFMIVPGNKAVRFSLELIKEYNRRFGDKYGKGVSTLSVGTSIAKPRTPVKVMLEEAEEKLSEAKEKVKAEECGGSLSYTILNAFNGNTGKAKCMLPLSVEQAEAVLNYLDSIISSDSAGSRLRNIAEAYETAESFAEANMFFAYMNAKEKDKSKRIALPDIKGYKINGGYYENDKKERYTIWNELLDLAGLEKEI